MINDKVERRSVANHLRNQKQLIIAAITSSKEKSSGDIKHIDQEIFKNGQEWFNCGLSLEDAPQSIRNNPSFIKGFERARRTQLVEDELYKVGIDFFKRGIPLSNIPEIYRNNDIVEHGYIAASKESQKK